MTKNDQKMQNFSLFVAKLEKIHKKVFATHNCTQHIFLLHLPLKIGYIYNIHWCKGPEIKKTRRKKATKRPKNVKFVEQ